MIHRLMEKKVKNDKIQSNLKCKMMWIIFLTDLSQYPDMINPSTILQKYKEEQERKAKKARPGRSLALTKLEELNQVRWNLSFEISEGLLLSNNS